MFNKLREEIAAVKANDPAAPSSFTIMMSYGGIQSNVAHRWCYWMWNHHMKGLARWVAGWARFATGIEIHPAAQIGRRFFIDHGTGVVIGETTIIGDDVTVYQGVTLGGTGKESGKRHPTLEDGVVVGTGAKVLGDITIGARSKIGGGSVVVNDVPPDCTVVGVPGHIVRRGGKRVESKKDDCRHKENLPDPVASKIENLEAKIAQLEAKLEDVSKGSN